MSKFIRVDDWVPSEEDRIVNYGGKLIYIPFHEIFNRKEIENINSFFIKKESYSKKLKELTHYINYFIKFYDHDNELLLIYLKVKYFIDTKKLDGLNNSISPQVFKEILYSLVFNKSIIEKIDKLVEDNYYIDVSSDADSDRKYADSLKFTNKHAKIMMKISMAIKLIVPILFHYINSHMLIRKEPVELYAFYEKLFTIFGEGVKIYNKLWYTINVKVTTNCAQNKLIWEQREFRGTNELEQVDHLLREKLIAETFFKYTFNGNIINFNSVVINTQLNYFRIEKYLYSYIELSNTRDIGEGLSGLKLVTIKYSNCGDILRALVTKVA